MKLNKIKDILSSVKAKLFMTLSSTILLIILFLIVVNNFALEKFYLYKKQNTLKTVYESINNYYKTPGQDNDIQTELEKLSIKNNFDILIKDNNGINLYTTNKNFSTVIGSINDILDRINTSGGKELESNDNYTIKKQRDIKNGLTYMMLSGKMENGYFLYIRIPLNSIQEFLINDGRIYYINSLNNGNNSIKKIHRTNTRIKQHSKENVKLRLQPKISSNKCKR